MTTNRAASIRARLKQHTDATGEDFNLVLTRFGIERLLYRLATSEYATQFVLKGALLFALWYGSPHRPTRDADLLGFGPDDPDVLAAVFRSLCTMQVDDGIRFEAASVRVGTIRKEARYGGVRVDIQATLDSARIALQVDVGFGDAVTPCAVDNGLSGAAARRANRAAARVSESHGRRRETARGMPPRPHEQPNERLLRPRPTAAGPRAR
jgi:hypothetical protein